MENRILLAHEVADLLNISIGTVRNYAKALERSGHVFSKRKQARLWTETEINRVREVTELYNNYDYPLEMCFEYVVTKHEAGEDKAKEVLQHAPYISNNDPDNAQIEALTGNVRSLLDELTNNFESVHNKLNVLDTKIDTQDNSIDYKEMEQEYKNEVDHVKSENEKLSAELEALEDEKKQLEEQIEALKDMNTFEFWKFKRE